MPRPKQEKTGRHTVRLSAVGIREPILPALEEDLEQKIKDIVQAEIGFLTAPAAMGMAKPGLPGLPGQDGEDGEDGKDGLPGSILITAGNGIAKSGNTLSADLEGAAANKGGLTWDDGAEDEKTIRVKANKYVSAASGGIKLTSNGVELFFDPDQFQIDETKGLQTKLDECPLG